MRRREFLKSAAVGSATVACQESAAAERPNFLFLIADDLTYRAIHALGDSEVKTPHMDSLARGGCAFTHCFHQGSWQPAVCVASRTMLNTGLTAFRAQRQVDKTPLWGETLGAAGYNTCLIGKWHVSRAAQERSFKETGPLSPGMFESGPSAYNRPSPGNTWTPWDTSLKGQWLHTAEWQKAKKDEVKHSAQIWAESAADQIASLAGRNAPFFLYVGFNSPHDPRQAPKEFGDMYPSGRIRIPPNYLMEHPFDQGDHRGRDEILAPFPRTREAVQVHRSEYYAHITFLDAQIGRILDALKKSGKDRNTYVILTADHGLAVGQHGLMGKQNLYDHSTRMPLLISGPGVPRGKKVGTMVYQHSMFATTCEFAGVPIPKVVEFPSLVDSIVGKGSEKHDAVFCFYRNFQRSVRTKDHKLIVYPQARVSQLFDLKKDPWETRNLADKPQYAAVQRALLARLHQFQQELEDDLPLPA